MKLSLKRDYTLNSLFSYECVKASVYAHALLPALRMKKLIKNRF